MSSATTYDVVHDYLVANWTTTAIAFENEPHPLPDTPEHWVFVEIYGDLFAQMSIGAGSRDTNLWRETGQVLLNVMAPRETGSRLARLYANQLADLLRGKDIGVVRFLDASIGAGQAGEGDGNYWRMTATIDWERDQ